MQRFGTAQDSQLTNEERKEIAKARAKKLASDGADNEARARYLAYLADPACEPERRARIVAVQEWSDSVFAEYVRVKERIYAGDPSAAFDPRALPPCPYAWDEIIGVSFS